MDGRSAWAARLGVTLAPSSGLFFGKLVEVTVAEGRCRVVQADRNDPCPFGSGKKYKHCCGRA